MRNFKIVTLIFTAIIFFISCEKEKSRQEIPQQAVKSKMILQKSANASSTYSQAPFEIHSAGLFQGVLYMSVSYTGGEKIHEFTVNWNGNIVNEGTEKVMDLTVYHSDVNDRGNLMLFDSITANIIDLGITNEELNDLDLWIRVTNSTNPDNVFFFKAVSESVDPVDPVDIIYNREVKVVREGCSEYGIWGELWLISNDSDPVSHYFVTEMESSVSYIPVENELLKIEFRYSYIADSSMVCPQLNQLKPLPVKITRVIR